MSGRLRILSLIAASFLTAIAWHPAYADVVGRPHDLSLENPKGHCLNCHDPHQPKLGAGFPHTLKKANEIAVCYQCHAGAQNNYSSIDPSLTSVTSVQSFYNIRAEFSQTNIHFPNFGMDGEVNKCSECHNPHGVMDSNSQRKPKLLSAGQDAVTDTDDFCLVCHNSDPNPPHRPFSNISVRDQFKFSRTDYKQMRHSTFFRWSTLNEPAPDSAHTYDDNPYGKGKDISCLTCHRPHGSPNSYMLKVADNQGLCLACHKGGVIFGTTVPSLSAFTSTGHGKSALGSYKRICQDCHFPHGTGQKNAIKKIINDPHTLRNMTANLSNGVNEACFACHGQGSAPVAYFSFDSSTAGWQGAGLTQTIDTTKSFSGAGSLKQVSTGWSYSYSGNITVTPSAAYNLSACVYIPASLSGYAYLTVDEYNSGGGSIISHSTGRYSTATSTWQRVPLSFTTASNAASVIVRLYFQGPGTVYWDEISLANPATLTYYAGKAVYNSGIHKTSPNALNPKGVNGQAPGDCDNCHDPHGQGNDRMLVEPNDQTLCFDCHNSATPNTASGADIMAAFQSASHHDLTKVKCINCHNPHMAMQSSPMMDPLNTAEAITDKTNFCLGCHSGTMPAGVSGAPNINTEWGGGGHNRQHLLSCSDCHASHGSPNPSNLNYTTITSGGYSARFTRGLSFDSRAYCEACHSRTGTGFKGASSIPVQGYVSQHAEGDTTPCSQCHTKKHNPYLPSYTGASAYYNLNCLNCHTQGTGNAYPNVNAEFNGMASRHALTYNPPSANDCTKCHGTHSNLTPANDVIDPDSANPANKSLDPNVSNTFCLQCHDSTPVSIGGQTPPNILDTYTAAGHGMASANVLCSQCHEHHGSVNKKLIKQTINNSPVSFNYSGINTTTCAACHKDQDRALAYWPGYSTYSGSVHAYGNPTTGNLVTDGLHGTGVCSNCHNPHGARVDGKLVPYMTYKKEENLCYRCHASGFDNFSTAGDYNNKWNHFGSFLSVAKQIDTSGGNRLAGLHFGQTGGQSIGQNITIWDGLVSSNAFPDNDSVITVSMKIPNYSFYAGNFTAGLKVEDAVTSSDFAATGINFVDVRYRMHTSPPAWICRYSGDSGPVGPNAFGDESANYHTLTIIRRKTFGTFSAYIDNIAIRGGTFNTSGYFKVRLYCGISGNTSVTPEKLEAWFRKFNVQYASGGSTRNTSSGDDVQARFYMNSHHKISDADQTDGSKVECVDCHDPHTITEKKMGFENISGAAGKGVQPVVADQNFCLKCHNNNPPAGVRFPADNTAWDKSLFDSSAHGNPLKRYKTLQSGQVFLNYSNGITYSCKVCHNPHGSDQAHMQRDSWDIDRDGIPDDINGDSILDSATQVGFIGYSTGTRRVMLVSTIAGIPSRSTFKRVSTTIPYQANGSIDVMLCLNCHNGKPAPDVKSDFMKPSHHDVTFADQTAHGYSKIECYNCHDQHRTQARDDAAGEYPTTNPTDGRDPMPGDAAFCLKCHNTDNGSVPPGVSGVSFGRLKLKNIKLSYNPNNYTDAKGYDLITSSGQGHYALVTGKAVMCRACHNQHGSNNPKMLRDDTVPGSPGYDAGQPIQNMRPVALGQSDPFGGGGGKQLSTTAERCLSCHSGGTTYEGNLIPIPPPPNSVYIGFSSLPEVGKHPDIKAGLNVGNGLASSNGHLYSNTFAVSTSLGSIKDACTLCHDSHNPNIPTKDDELLDCYRCHNINTSLPDVQTEFDANPLNASYSKSYHPIKYDPTSPSGVECRKCHDQAKHMQGRVRLRKDPGNSTSLVDGTERFTDYTSEARVWTSQPTAGGFISDSTQPFTNNSAMTVFCMECHGRSSTVASSFNGTDAKGVSGRHDPPTVPFGTMSGAHFTDGRLVCTNCHEYHGSVSTTLKKNSFTTNFEPAPAEQTKALEGPDFCYGCHRNAANSKDGINIFAQFSGTASHHKISASDQAASGDKLSCTDCHNVHVATREKAVIMADNTTVAAVANDAFCIGCHDQNGKKGVQFPGFANGTSGQEWDQGTGSWNMWDKQAYSSSPHSAPGGVTCRSCHDPHGSSNYRLLLTNISSASGAARNIKVSFGVHSTSRGKRKEEIGVNGVCAACHKKTMGNYSGNTLYPGYASYTSMTFGRKSGVDKNCTYCHNPHGTSQTRFENDTSPAARMMRANRPLYMNMTSKSFGSVYNFKRGGFSNGTTGAPYYMFCSSRGCHASERTQFDTFRITTTVDRFDGREKTSSHHPLKEGVIGCTSCHKEHGTSTKATDYVSPDLRASYFRGSNWPVTWHSGIGPYRGGSSNQGVCYGWNAYESCNPDRNMVTGSVTPPANANNLCFMCHQQEDIIGASATGMAGTNTKFLGHEAVAGGAVMSHQISPGTPLSGVSGGEYHNFSCSVCHFPHTSTQSKLLKTSCFSQADNKSPGSGYDAWGCHPFQKWANASNIGWRNLTTSSKTIFNRPTAKVADLAVSGVDQTQLTVTLSWTAVMEGSQKADHYNVYRATQFITQDTKPLAVRVSRGAAGSGAPSGALMSLTDKYWVLPNQRYYYVVVACDSQNNESFISNCVSASTGPDTVAPNAISTQQLRQVDGTYGVKVFWNDPGDNVNVTNYKIYRMVNATSIINISQATYVASVSDTLQTADGGGYPADTNTYSYTDTNLTQEQGYAYAVVALDQTGNVSNVPTGQIRNITIANPRPAAISTLAIVPVSKSITAQLSWSAPTSVGGITSYNIYRDTQQSMGTKTLVYSTPNGTTTTYTDTVPSAGATYYYVVTAVNSNATVSPNESDLSNVVSVNIPAPPSGTTAYNTVFNEGTGPRPVTQVNWNAPAYAVNLAYYNLYWRLNGGAWNILDASNASSPKIADGLSINGNMENWGTSAPTNWSVSGVTAALDRTMPHGGQLSAKLTTTASGDNFMYLTQTYVPVLPSKAYTFSGWIYIPTALTGGYTVDGVNGAYTALRIIEYGSGGWTYVTEHENIATARQSTNGWVYVSDTWRTNANTTYLQLRVEVQGKGTVYWDDLRLTPSTTAGTSAKIDFTGTQPGSYDIYAAAVYSSYANVSPYESYVDPGNAPSANVTVSDTSAPSGPAPSWSLSGDGNHAVIGWPSPSDNNFTDYPASGIDHYVISASYNQGASWGAIINSLVGNQSFESLSSGTVDQYTCSFTGWSGSNTLIYAVSDSLFDGVAAKLQISYLSDRWFQALSPSGASIANKTYSLSFWAKANKPTSLMYDIQAAGGNWNATSDGFITQPVGTLWQRFTTSGMFSSTAGPATQAAAVIRAPYDTSATITIDGVRLCEGTEALNADDGACYQPSGSPSFTDPNTLSAGGSATYRIQAIDGQYNYSAPVFVTAYGRPTAITNLAVSYSRTSSANVLSWSAASSQAGLSSYKVYAAEQNTPLTTAQLISQNLIGTVTTNLNLAQTYTHNVQYGNSWAYAVVAEDIYVNDSAISNNAVITDPPVKVTDLALSSPVGSSQVNITWSTPYDGTGATGYKIYRLPASINDTPQAVTDGNYTSATLIYTGTYASSVQGTPNSYTDGTWYDTYDAYYAVRSSDAAGNWSLVSNSTDVIVGRDSTPPATPTITSVKAVASPEVDIYWTAATDPDDQVSGYALYRADAASAPFDTDGCITADNIQFATKIFDTIPYYATSWADTGGTPGHTYYYALRAYDTANPMNWSGVCSSCCWSATVATTAVVTTPPNWTSGSPLTVTGDPAVQYPDIDLDWTPASDNGAGQAGKVDHYSIYRSAQPFSSTAGMTPIATVAGTSSSYIDNTGISGTTYYYGVTAVDDSANHLESALSNVASAVVGPEPCTDSGANYPEINNIPTVPAGFTATVGAYPYINLAWNESADTDDCGNIQPLMYYRLYYALSGTSIPDDAHDKVKYPTEDSLNRIGVYTLVIDNMSRSYSFRGVGGNSYNYRIEAYDMADNYSGLSVNASAQVAPALCTTTAPPSAPGSFAAKVGPAPDMDLTWSASAVGGCSGSNLIDHYNLYKKQCMTFDAQGNPLPSITASTVLSSITPTRISGNSASFIDSTGLPNTPYSYVLTAVDSLGNESAMSVIVTKTTEADTIPPAAINDMKASTITGGGIQVYWCRPSDNVGIDHYDIYRVSQSTIVTDCQVQQSCNPKAVKIASSYNTGPCVTYNDMAVSSGVTYSYAVIAVDAAGNRSTISKGISAGDTICTAP